MTADVSPETRAFIDGHRVGRLATADAGGTPHVVPVCYAYDGRYIYSALDLKAKRVAARRLKRVRNIETNPRVALVIDEYDEDWDVLAYVLVHGTAEVLEGGPDRAHGATLLREKYPQYRELLEEGCTVLRIDPERVVVWGEV